jgi:hypothetical protein
VSKSYNHYSLTEALHRQGDQMNLWKMAQNVCYLCNETKLPKVRNHSMAENSPNLATLALESYLGMHLLFFINWVIWRMHYICKLQEWLPTYVCAYRPQNALKTLRLFNLNFNHIFSKLNTSVILNYSFACCCIFSGKLFKVCQVEELASASKSKLKFRKIFF